MLIALTAGMRMAEIFALTWSDILYREELIGVRAILKGGKIRYVPIVMDPKSWTRKRPFLRWSAALKMKESQCHERERVTHPA